MLVIRIDSTIVITIILVERGERERGGGMGGWGRERVLAGAPALVAATTG
jgi:hypothetical protein